MTQTTNTQPKPRKLRGWATYEGDEFTFKPTEEGSPSQLNVKTCKGAKTFETTSETKPLRVAHLTCPANAADPYAEYVSQLERLGIKPRKEKKMLEKQRVVCEEGMQVFLESGQGRLTFQGCIDLHQNLNWQSELMRLMQIIMRNLPVNKRFTTLISKIRKGGQNHV